MKKNLKKTEREKIKENVKIEECFEIRYPARSLMSIISYTDDKY